MRHVKARLPFLLLILVGCLTVGVLLKPGVTRRLHFASPEADRAKAQTMTDTEAADAYARDHKSTKGER
jgi:hypothetical protein